VKEVKRRTASTINLRLGFRLVVGFEDSTTLEGNRLSDFSFGDMVVDVRKSMRSQSVHTDLV